MWGQSREHRVQRPEKRREVRPRREEQLKRTQRRHHEPAIVRPKVHVPKHRDGVKHSGCNGIPRQNPLQDAAGNIFPDGHATLPCAYVRPKSLIREPLRLVLQRLGRELEVYKVVARGGAALVGMMQCGYPAVARLDILLRGVEGEAELCVVGWSAEELVVGFVDGVGQVEADDGDLDLAAICVEARGTGSGLRVAGADGDTVIDCLDPGRDDLWTCEFGLRNAGEDVLLREGNPIRGRIDTGSCRAEEHFHLKPYRCEGMKVRQRRHEDSSS